MKLNPVPNSLEAVLQALPFLDIPAKGRIAHHIRTGRLERAIELCAVARLFLWKLVWTKYRPILLEQLNQLKHVESLLRMEAGHGDARLSS